VDLDCLARQLQLPVVGTSAGSREGLESLLEAVERISHPGSRGGRKRVALTPDRRAALAEQCAAMAVTQEKTGGPDRQRRLDRLLTARYTGLPVMAALLGLVLWITIAGANVPSRLLSGVLFGLGEELRGVLAAAGVPEKGVHLLVDGVYRVLAWVVSVMLPPMAIFFPLFTLLEDLGYLPRAAFVLDHAFQKAGACGKQALTVCMGFGCNACGVTGCRIIDSPRERLIAILTNSLVPCNGRFPTLIALITMFFVGSAGGVLSSLEAALARARQLHFSGYDCQHAIRQVTAEARSGRKL
jgi:ferrous iron transport protein B